MNQTDRLACFSRATLPALALPALALSTAIAGPVWADSHYQVDTVVEGLEHPWGMAFLPGGSEVLVTERPGRLQLVDISSGEVSMIDGLPQVDARGQGGLLDVALPPDFEADPWVYLTYAGRNADGLTSTHIGRGRFDREAGVLSDFQTLHMVEPHIDSTGHYGSRLVFDDDGHFFVTVGDRQSKDFSPAHYSQDISTGLGSTLRFNADGSIPRDNPFVDDPDAQHAIYSMGHRNAQGMAIHPETGELWQNEHGEFNGDEINVIQAGGNYGWPIATYAVDYRTQARFAERPPEVEGTIDPVYFWEPDHPEGFPPSGFLFYQGDAFPDWQGDAFMGNLAHQYLGRFTVDGHDVDQAERLVAGRGWRIRDVTEGPADGYIYLLVDAADAPLVRLTP